MRVEGAVMPKSAQQIQRHIASTASTALDADK